MIAVSGKRKLLYGVLVIGLLGANALRWSTEDSTTAASSERAVATEVAPLPALMLSRELGSEANIGTIDIFARSNPTPVAAPPPPPVQVAASRPAIDPMQIARDAAIRQFEAIDLVGIMRSGNATQVVLRLDGQNRLLTVGQDILPGFVIESATNDTVRITHEHLGMAGIVSMNSTQETIILDQQQ